MDLLIFGFAEDLSIWERTGFRGRVPNLLRAFSNDKRVGKILFVNNPTAILRFAKNIVLKRRWWIKQGESIRLSHFTYVTKVDEKIYTLDWVGLRLFSEKDFWMRITKGSNGWHLLRLIKKTLIVLDMKNIVIWTSNPFTYNLTEDLEEEFFIYDSVDNWLEHPYLKRYFSNIEYAYTQISKIADFVTIVSKQLREIFESRGAKEVVFLPNAVDYQHYSHQNSGSFPTLEDIKSIEHPIIGLVGILSNDIDFELLRYLAYFNKNWNIVLVGSMTEGTDMRAVAGLKNVHFLGYKPPQIVPDYLASFDVCLSVYKMNASSDSKDPMKLYEYLASGKPIVSTDIREARKLNSEISIVSSKEEFAKKIEESLVMDSDEDKKKRLWVAKENSWEKRARTILDLIELKKNDCLDLSLIIVNWNTKDLLRKCLNSIYNNIKGINFEVIVVDNCSSDGSVKMVKNEFPQVTLIENKINIGFGRANNQGFSKSRGRHLLFLNPDTLIISGRIADLLKFSEAHPSIGIIGPKILNLDNSTQVSCQGFPRLWWILLSTLGLLRFLPKKIKLKFNCYFHNFNASCYVDSVGGACILIKRKVFALVGGFDEEYFMYGEDLDLGYRALQYNFKSYFLNMPLIIHLQNQSGAKRWDSFSRLKENYRSLHLFCYKHYAGKIGVFIFRFIICSGSFIRIGIYGLTYLLTRNKRYWNNMELNKNIFLINFKNSLI